MKVTNLIPHRYGQLSGMVEPIAGVLGAISVSLFEPCLPWALAFAGNFTVCKINFDMHVKLCLTNKLSIYALAGAMIYVVLSEVIPEAHQGGYVIKAVE